MNFEYIITIKDCINEGLWGLVFRLQVLDMLSYKYYISSILEVIVITGERL